MEFSNAENTSSWESICLFEHQSFGSSAKALPLDKLTLRFSDDEHHVWNFRQKFLGAKLQKLTLTRVRKIFFESDLKEPKGTLRIPKVSFLNS